MRLTAMEAERKSSQEIDVVGVCEIAVKPVPPDFAEMRLETSSRSRLGLRGLRLEGLRILGKDLPARTKIS